MRIRPAVGVVLVAALALCAGHALAATVGPSPAPGAIITAPPQAVTVPLTGQTTDPTVWVLDTQGTNRTTAPAVVQGDAATVPVRLDGPGVYTVLYGGGDGPPTASYTFTLWRGGPLPPVLAEAARGGPAAGNPAPGVWLWSLIAFVMMLVLVGGIPHALSGGGSGSRPLRRVGARAGVGLALSSLLAACYRAASLLRLPLPRAIHSPLFIPLLMAGLGPAWLVAAAAGLVAAIAGLAGGAIIAVPVALVAMFACLFSVPLLAAHPVLIPLAVVGCLLGGGSAGALPFTLRNGRGQAGPGPIVLLAASWAALLGLLYFAHRTGALSLARADAVAAVGVIGIVLLASARGRRRSRPAAACQLALVIGLGLCAPLAVRTLAREPAPEVPGTVIGARAGTSIAVTSVAPGANTVTVSLPRGSAPSTAIDLSVSNPEQPALDRTLTLPRARGGTYLVTTDALSIPGRWQLSVQGAVTTTFALILPQTLPTSCTTGFLGFRAVTAHLSHPVTATTTMPGDPERALVASGERIYVTRDGGLTWVPVPGWSRGTVTALAIGEYGRWYALTPGGVWSTVDSGATWQAEAGIYGAATAAYLPLYPAGNPGWLAVGGRIYEQGLGRDVYGGTVAIWLGSFPLPATATAVASLPPVTTGASAPLLVGGPSGLWGSLNGGYSFQKLASTAVTQLVGGPNDTIWAVGPEGLSAYSPTSGSWQAVLPSPQSGLPAPATSVALDPAGDVFAAVPGQGLFERGAAGPWRSIGCPGATPTLLTGTYSVGSPVPPGTPPLVYVADDQGNLVALQSP